jgi:hypothetical protein
MDVTQENSQIISENLEPVFREFDDLENHETNDESNERSKFADLIRGSRGYLIGLTFVAGLLLGWMVIGWWLWPVQWTNSEPWHLRPRHQRTFVRLVAEDYWQTGDISRAREALAGWDKEALAELLATMENQASSTEERQHLIALAEALEMPDANESLVAFLLSQKAILFSSTLSASPLVIALALAAYSLVQNRTRAEAPSAVEEQSEEELLEELLAQGEEAQEGRQDQEGEGKEPDQEEEQQEEEGEQQDQEQKEKQDGEEEYEEDDEEEEEPWAQDLISDLFDGDDLEITQLETLCKNLPDIDVSDLLEHSKQTANDLSRSNALGLRIDHG